MDPIILLFGAVGLSFIGFIVYTANQNEATGQASSGLRWMLYVIAFVVGLYGFSVLQTAMLSTSSPEILEEAGIPLPPISVPAAVANFVLAITASVFSFRVIRSTATREWIARIVGPNADYRASSVVHLTAAVLCLAMLSVTIGQLVIVGGLSGMALELETNTIDVTQLLFNMVMQVVIAFLGVGMAIRRTLEQTMERLGLRIPTSRDLIAGLLAAAALYLLAVIVGIIWSALVPPETLQEQTAAAEQLAGMFSTLPLAFILALTAAVGEEILFRGALQPIFGLVLTSVFFALIHSQYALTPATLLIFAVSIVFGLLRQRYSTTAAIFAHFFYNLVTLALPILAGMSAGGGL